MGSARERPESYGSMSSTHGWRPAENSPLQGDHDIAREICSHSDPTERHPMKRFIPACMALAASLLVSSTAYAATPVTDCPLRDAPFSIESPLVDILLSPAAKAGIDKAEPGR